MPHSIFHLGNGSQLPVLPALGKVRSQPCLSRASVLTAAPPLLAIDHVAASIPLDAALHIGGIA